MAIKKKVTAKKSASPKKKAAKKKSVTKNEVFIQDEELVMDEQTEREEETPSYPEIVEPRQSHASEPVDSGNSEDTPPNPMLKYVIVAGLILALLIGFSMLKKKDTGAGEPTSKASAEKVEPVAEPKKEEPAQPVVEGKKEGATEEVKKVADPVAEKTAAPVVLKGYAVTQMVSGKNFAEAKDHCRALGMKLPLAEQLKAANKGAGSGELSNAVVWTGDVVGGKNLKFTFSTNKAQYTTATEKFQVLCKE